jgi:hypothetical protein
LKVDADKLTKEQAREYLAALGAVSLIEENDKAMLLAEKIKKHAERITGCGNTHHYPPGLLDVLEDAVELLAKVGTLAGANDPAPLG